MPTDLVIAVISDTHNRVPDSLPSRIKSADEIWHLGDVCRPETLDTLSALPPELTVVQGNCDPYFNWEERITLERNGRRFRLQHMPPTIIDSSLTALLFGHLHHPIRESENGVLTLNPGAVTGPRHGSKSSFAWLKIAATGSWTWDVQTI